MLNCLVVAGRLVKNPEFKESKEVKYATFSIAVETGKEETSFFDCIAPEYCLKGLELCHKGDKIAVEGYLRQRRFKTKEGKETSAIQIVVDHLEFIDVKKVEEEKPSEEAPF